MAELITIDKDALIRAIYSCTDASEVDARTIVDSVTAPPLAGARLAVPPGIYVASRASIPERPMMWQGLRLKGWPITSTWIDEAGEGETGSYIELWLRIHNEIAASAGLLLYAEVDDFPLKGALVECGIALGMGKPVAFVLPDVALSARSMKPIGSWAAHPNVRRFDDLAAAKDWLLTKPQTLAVPAATSEAVAPSDDVLHKAANRLLAAHGFNPSTFDLVLRFAQALAERLAAAQMKYGYSDGWLPSDWMDERRKHLLNHVIKGDPLDVAAYCAFLWHHGAKTFVPTKAAPYEDLMNEVTACGGEVTPREIIFDHGTFDVFMQRRAEKTALERVADDVEATLAAKSATIANLETMVREMEAPNAAYFDAYLCQAWGETDLPTAEIVRDLAAVRRFMVREWWGEENPTAYDSDEKMGDKVMQEIAAHNWRDEGPWTVEFEIGGVSVTQITGWAAPVSREQETGEMGGA